MKYEHVLVAVDLTDECSPVIARGREIAERNGAKLSLVHIVEPMAMAFGGDVPMDLSQLQQQQFDQAKEKLSALKSKFPDTKIGEAHFVYGEPDGHEQVEAQKPDERKEVKAHLLYGQPRQEIHKLAEDHKCDLIVIGSHGRHGLALLLGSTANDVLHGAPCDVLAVRLKKAE